MNDAEPEIVEHEVRSGYQCVAQDRRDCRRGAKIDAGKDRVLRWFVCFGWIVSPCAVLLAEYAMGLI